MPRCSGRPQPALLLVSAALLAAGCQLGAKPSGPYVKVQSVAARVHWPAGKATLESSCDGGSGLQIRKEDLLPLVTEDNQPQSGVAPSDRAALVIITKRANDARYWRLTEHVKAIKLKSPGGGITLKTVCQAPLRVEVWLETPEEVALVADMK